MKVYGKNVYCIVMIPTTVNKGRFYDMGVILLTTSGVDLVHYLISVVALCITSVIVYQNVI